MRSCPRTWPTLNSAAFTQPGSAPASEDVFEQAVERSSVVPFNPGWPELRTAVEPELVTMFDDPVIDLDAAAAPDRRGVAAGAGRPAETPTS